MCFGGVRANRVMAEPPKVGIRGPAKSPVRGLQEERTPGRSSEPFPAPGSGATSAGSLPAPAPCPGTHLSWSAGDRAAAQAISARAHWGETRRETRRNSAPISQTTPFPAEVLPSGTPSCPRPSPDGLFWHLSLGARIPAPDVAFGPSLSR